MKGYYFYIPVIKELMIAKAKFYKGIEFICVSELPADQQLLLQHVQEPERIKILMDGKILSNCIQYRDYCHWFNTVYKSSVQPAAVEQAPVMLTPVQVLVSKG